MWICWLDKWWLILSANAWKFNPIFMFASKDNSILNGGKTFDISFCILSNVETVCRKNKFKMLTDSILVFSFFFYSAGFLFFSSLISFRGGTPASDWLLNLNLNNILVYFPQIAYALPATIGILNFCLRFTLTHAHIHSNKYTLTRPNSKRKKGSHPKIFQFLSFNSTFILWGYLYIQPFV